MTAAATTTPRPAGRRSAALLWLGILAAPSAWMLQLLCGWAMEEFACATGTAGQDVYGLDTGAVIAGISIGAIALAGVGLSAAAWSCRRGAPAGGDPGRRRMMAQAGVLTSSLFLLLIVLSLVQMSALGSCRMS